MAACHCEGVLCLKGSSVQSPGSWQGGSWVSALLGDVFCLTPSQDLALGSCVSLSFMSKISNSPAHQLLWSLGAVLSVLPLPAFVVFCLFVWFFLGCVCGVCCFVCVLLVGYLGLTRLRTIMVCAPLLNPQRGIQCMHMRNSFIQHNNVRRPGESHRGAGRKKPWGTHGWLDIATYYHPHHLYHLHHRVGREGWAIIYNFFTFLLFMYSIG